VAALLAPFVSGWVLARSAGRR